MGRPKLYPDSESSLEIANLKPGDVPTVEQALAVADALKEPDLDYIRFLGIGRPTANQPSLHNTLTELFEGTEVRVFGTIKIPLFIAADIAPILGYADTRDMLRGVEEDERQMVEVEVEVSNQHGATGVTQKVEMVALNEFGLYRCITKSTKPVAKQFQRWVFHEVIPSIRNRGVYESPEYIAMQQKAEGFDKMLPFMDALGDHTKYLSEKKAATYYGAELKALAKAYRDLLEERCLSDEQAVLENWPEFKDKGAVKSRVDFVIRHYTAAIRAANALRDRFKGSQWRNDYLVNLFIDCIKSELDFVHDWAKRRGHVPVELVIPFDEFAEFERKQNAQP